ncbi:MAG: radical SAM family heme chaperone HemW, partial [Dichotomicrobium sp.]
AAKCPYCDFNSHVPRSAVDEARFARALIRELGHYASRTPGRRVDTVFFGGGTPSLMSAQTVAAVLDAIAGLWTLSSRAEISLEANPSSVEAARFAGYRAAGVNRVSLGVQSLHDDALGFLGRLHSAEQARAALEVALAHFQRVSIDLIYARPAQSVDGWRQELREALDLGVRHLSAYQLTIEPGTAFHRLHTSGKLAVPDADKAADLYAATCEICDAAGLRAYEVSNYAVPGEESRHNLIYWRYGDYAGVGPGAHGRLSRANGERVATEALRDPAAWLAQVERVGYGVEAETALSLLEQAEEILLMGLRLAEGVPLARLRRLSGHDIAIAAVEELRGLGLVTLADDRLRVTDDGRLLLNQVALRLADALVPASLQAAAEAAG